MGNSLKNKLGLIPKSFFGGWWYLLCFNIIIFVLVQLNLINNWVEFPEWVLDKDPILFLVIVVLLQELIFRGLIISWLEHFGKQKALLISTIIFGLSHLVFPDAELITLLSLIGGYFWGWHFLKFRNLYLLIISHLLVNLGFNYIVFNLLQ